MLNFSHTPVMLQEVIDYMQVQPSGRYVDCTFGAGGHSRAILNLLNAEGVLFAFDKDPDAINQGKSSFAHESRLKLFHASMCRAEEILSQHNLTGMINGILLDLGVSSMQLDNSKRGFSFQKEGMLDMRMDFNSGISAKAWLQDANESEIETVLRDYGEERYAKRIAKAIVRFRIEQPLITTTQLAELIAEVVPMHQPGIHPATRAFQAFRIVVNHELEELQRTLEQSLQILAPKARLLVISFHGIEHRIVKKFVRSHSQPSQPGFPFSYQNVPNPPALGKLGYFHPSQEEIKVNPRARSAKLTVAERLLVT